ncbi:MAG: cytochrome C [Betaproteobacteria bacterium]|nr:MAG: cytochrome C [Betaproteobacteria bacterium]
MKTSLVILASAAALFAAGTANADLNADLKAKGCLGCHDMDKKKVGPAFKDVAAKYKGDKAAAQTKLVAKLKDGKGHPKVKADENEIKSLVEGVLASAK